MKHVIIGAGPAGVTAAEHLRKMDPESSITIIGEENETPYSRMAIPYFLHGRIEEEGTHLRVSAEHFKDENIELIQARVDKVEPENNQLTLNNGDTVSYDKLLIATGSRPYRAEELEVGSSRVHACWTMDDARNIASLANKGDNVLLVGAGFVACIIMSALASRGVNLTTIVRGEQMVRSMMNPTASAMVKRWCLDKGIKVLTSTTITEATSSDKDELEVTFNNGDKMKPDLVVVATGVQPNVEFLAGSGIKLDKGILVDEYLCSNFPNIYAAGDMAQGYDFLTGEQAIHIIQPTAVEHGRTAAMNMAGIKTRFQGSLLMNVLDTMGLISGSFGRWQGVEGGDSAEILDDENYRYIHLEFKEDRLVGALTLGHTAHVGVVKGLIQSQVKLGEWKDKLIEDPSQLMSAYLAKTLPLGQNSKSF